MVERKRREARLRRRRDKEDSVGRRGEKELGGKGKKCKRKKRGGVTAKKGGLLCSLPQEIGPLMFTN